MSAHRLGSSLFLVTALWLSPVVVPAQQPLAQDPPAQQAPAQQAPSQQAPAPQTPAPAAGSPATPSYDQLKAAASGDPGPATASAEADGKPVDGKPADGANVPPAAAAQAAGKSKHGAAVKLKKVKKEKPPKLVPVNIVKGELTVDGLIAKADLNFQVLDLHYFYIWVPGMGTVVMSSQAFPGSKIQANALDGSTITVKVDGHQLQLACDHQLLAEKKPRPLSLFVALDTTYEKGSPTPEFGYGDKRDAPYSWPGSLADQHPNAKAPPLPPNLRQKTESVKICPKNPDGTPADTNCRVVEVPMVLGKKS